jgi:hypothetical protein
MIGPIRERVATPSSFSASPSDKPKRLKDIKDIKDICSKKNTLKDSIWDKVLWVLYGYGFYGFYGF